MSKVDAKNTQVVKEENQLGKHYMKIVEVVLNTSLALFDLVQFCRVPPFKCSHKCFNQLYMNFTRLSIGRWRV